MVFPKSDGLLDHWPVFDERSTVWLGRCAMRFLSSVGFPSDSGRFCGPGSSFGSESPGNPLRRPRLQTQAGMGWAQKWLAHVGVCFHWLKIDVLFFRDIVTAGHIFPRRLKQVEGLGVGPLGFNTE